MGKGDKRTKRGKTNNGSFGKTRPHRAPKKAAVASAAPVAAVHHARGRAR